MRRSSSSPAVSLFPFLAVLVCAMGALIFLLLVLTQKMRESAVAKLQKPPSAAVMAEVAPPELPLPSPLDPAEPEPADLPPVDPELLAPIGAIVADDEPLPPAGPSEHELRVAAMRAEYERRQQELESAARRELNTLRLQRQALLAELDQLRLEAADQQKQREQVEAGLSRSQATLRDRDRNADLMEQRLQAIAARDELLTKELQRLKSERERIRALPPKSTTAFTIVPYDGVSGTTRRPILIECTGDSIRFSSEQISLSARDLAGFTPEFNPLAAGADALMQYWQRYAAEHELTDSRQPYLLLVVRPEGTVAFYAARALLSPYAEDLGYELVSAEMPLTPPPTDPEAAAICKAAIERVLAAREDVASRLRGPVVVPRQDGFSLPRGDDPSAVGSRSWENPDNFGGTTNSATGNADTQGDLEQVRSNGSASQPNSGAIESRNRSTLTPPEAAVPNNRTASSPPPPRRSPSADNDIFPSRSAMQRNSVTRSSADRFQDLPSSPGGSSRSTSEAVPEERAIPRFDMRRRTTPQDVAARRKQFGQPLPGARIGFEKTIDVTVFPDRLEVLNQGAVPVLRGESTEELTARIAQHVHAEVDTWGNPPDALYWIPTVKFKVLPGGNQHVERLRRPLEDLGLRTRTDFDFVGTPATGNAFK